jgi:hypothetical protein
MEPLRPMNLGEILDRTFQIYRSRFSVFVAITAIPAIPMLGIELAEANWLETHSSAHPSLFAVIVWNYIYWLGLGQISGLLILLISPALMHVASAEFLGCSSSIWAALRFAVERWRSYLWIAILKLTAEVVIPEILVLLLIVVELVVVALAGGWPHPHVGGGFHVVLVVAFPVVAGIVLVLWIVPRIFLCVPAAAFEEIRGLRALRRSWMLTKGSRARMLATWVIVSLFSCLLIYGAGLAVRWIFTLIWLTHPFGMSVQGLYAPTVYVVWDIILVLIHPILSIAITLFYYDQRIRKEGYDIERMMDAAGLIAPPPPPAGDSPIASAPSIHEEARP